MGFLSLFTSSQRTNGDRTTNCTLVDGDSLLDERSNGSKSRPGDQVMALKWLSDLSKKEGLKLSVVFGGSPLREVSDGGDYRGVDVHFFNDAAERQTLILKLVKSSGAAGSVVVTADEDLRKRVVSAGSGSMRPSTLKKAGESSLGRSLRRRRSSRPGRRRARRCPARCLRRRSRPRPEIGSRPPAS